MPMATSWNKRGYRTLCDSFESANVLNAEAGTNGHVDGDGDTHTYIRLTDEASTQWTVRLDGVEHHPREVELVLCGGTELDTIIAALDFISNTLKTQYGLKGDQWFPLE